MKLDKEKFNQLKQLDRIEFRQRYNSINEGNVSLQIPVWALIIIASIFGTVGLVSGRISFLSVSLLVLKLAFILILLDVGLSLFISVLKSKKTRELEEEYFSVEVKKK